MRVIRYTTFIFPQDEKNIFFLNMTRVSLIADITLADPNEIPRKSFSGVGNGLPYENHSNTSCTCKKKLVASMANFWNHCLQNHKKLYLAKRPQKTRLIVIYRSSKCPFSSSSDFYFFNNKQFCCAWFCARQFFYTSMMFVNSSLKFLQRFLRAHLPCDRKWVRLLKYF